jgi:uncharacterized membrane protein
VPGATHGGAGFPDLLASARNSTLTPEARLTTSAPKSVHEGSAGLERLALFSDAVFAIAITLLVLEIKVPERAAVGSPAALLLALGELIPKFFAFFLSFVVIGYYWLLHHTIFRHLRRSDDTLMALNLVLLLLVAFLPFPVALFGSFRHYAPAVVFYSATLAATGIVLSLLVRHATRGRRLVDPGLDPHTVKLLYLRSLSLPVVFGVSIPLTLINPTWAIACWLLIVPAIRITRSRLQRQAAAARAASH